MEKFKHLDAKTVELAAISASIAAIFEKAEKLIQNTIKHNKN